MHVSPDFTLSHLAATGFFTMRSVVLKRAAERTPIFLFSPRESIHCDPPTPSRKQPLDQKRARPEVPCHPGLRYRRNWPGRTTSVLGVLKRYVGPYFTPRLADRRGACPGIGDHRKGKRSVRASGSAKRLGTGEVGFSSPLKPQALGGTFAPARTSPGAKTRRTVCRASGKTRWPAWEPGNFHRSPSASR